MAEVKPEEGEPGAEGEEVARKEHDVSIVLSFMNDEHEKVAIEVRRGKRRRMRARALDEPSGFLRVAALRPAREIRLSIYPSVSPAARRANLTCKISSRLSRSTFAKCAIFRARLTLSRSPVSHAHDS